MRELVVGELHTVKEIAQILGTDTGTVYRQAKRLGLPIYKRIDNDYEITDNSCHKKKFENRKKYRIKWIELMTNNPNKSKTELRRIDEATYTWLNKNDKDKEWLDENAPIHVKAINSKSNVNWDERDKYILTLIKNSLKYDYYESNEKPIRITIGYISRLINKPLVYYLSTNKMPETKKYVDSILEDIDNFRKRKIIWAINYFNNKNEEVTVNKVQQLLGFDTSIRKNYEDYIIEKIKLR